MSAAWQGWQLEDTIRAQDVAYLGYFQAWSTTRKRAEVTARIHFALMLHSAGLL